MKPDLIIQHTHTQTMERMTDRKTGRWIDRTIECKKMYKHLKNDKTIE